MICRSALLLLLLAHRDVLQAAVLQPVAAQQQHLEARQVRQAWQGSQSVAGQVQAREAGQAWQVVRQQRRQHVAVEVQLLQLRPTL
jgi:hypothetical protein